MTAAQWIPAEGIFVPGKPLTDIWAAPGLRWRATLEQHIVGALPHPFLTFTRQDRARYDLDNLVYPVVAVSSCIACESIWARVERGSSEGVLVRNAAPPPPPHEAVKTSVFISRPAIGSIRSRPPVPELQHARVLGGEEPVGVALEFDDAGVAVGEMSFDGPVKSLIDDLAPLLGQRLVSGRMLASDDRIRELRITRGHEPGRGGVTVTVWRLE